MTPRQLHLIPLTHQERGRLGGKASWRTAVRKALAAYPGNLDLAARHLTGHMRGLPGFKNKRAITLSYMRQWEALLQEENGNAT